MAVLINTNKITADGQYELTKLIAGQYKFSAIGVFGGGSLSVHHTDGEDSPLFAKYKLPDNTTDMVLTSNAGYTIVAENEVMLSLSGSTNPNIALALVKLR